MPKLERAAIFADGVYLLKNGDSEKVEEQQIRSLGRQSSLSERPQTVAGLLEESQRGKGSIFREEGAQMKVYRG